MARCNFNKFSENTYDYEVKKRPPLDLANYG